MVIDIIFKTEIFLLGLTKQRARCIKVRGISSFRLKMP